MLGPYVDGELEPPKLIEMDEHVTRCGTCGEEVQLLRAIRGSMKRIVRSTAPGGLRERIGNAMAAERARADVRADAEDAMFGAMGPAVKVASWRTMVPLATAAAIALAWGAATRGSQADLRASELHAGLGTDLLSEFVEEHSQPLPPEATDPKAVRGLETLVGVPVHPESFERGGAHFVGGRVVRLNSQRTMMFQYVVGTAEDPRRVSVLVYNPQKLQVGVARLAPRAIGTAEVRVGQEKGYSVAATQRAGVGYLFASDLDPDRLAAMANEGR